MDESGIEATQALDFGDYEDDVTDDELGDGAPVAYLNVACQKGFPGKLYPVYEGDNVIGRGDECKISIPLKALSREHACIEVKGDSHFIYDKGSRNRTRRNKHFLAASVRYELKHKDKLIFGDVECQYKIGSQADDDGDETGSESMFQTAPDDEELDDSIETKDKTEVKPPEEEDYASDASSDILEPTQPSAGGTQSMLGHRTLNGNSTLAQNITVKETPAAPRTKRFTEDIVLPESGSDTDDEGFTKPPATLAIAADSQEDDEEEVKSKMMGAATQAYICESDVTTDDEENTASKRSLLAAPTQAFVDEDDISTCSEDSPQKKMLLTAATQAFPADSDDEKSKSKKEAKVAPTIAYDMDVGIEPTQGYDMDVDAEEKDENSKSKKEAKVAPTIAYDMDVGIEPTQGYDMDVDAEERDENEEKNKSSGHSILFEPTQAYLGNAAAEEKDEDGKSDTSEEFVLEGDTDAEDEAEDNEDVGEMLAAPTLACDAPGMEEAETQVVATEEPTLVVNEKTEDDATVAVGDEPTQVFDEPKADETVPVTEVETQVFSGNGETSKKSGAIDDDATQVFDQNEGDKDNRELAERPAAATQIFDENATQVFDNEHVTKPVSKDKRQSDQIAETQVFDKDATQCFDEKKEEQVKDSEVVETQLFEDRTHVMDDKTDRKEDPSKQYEMATQVFDNDADGAADEEGQTFDITATSTLAVIEDIDEESDTETGVGVDDATQVFDGAVVTDGQTVPIESGTEQQKSRGRREQKQDSDQTVALDDATQVFEEKTPQPKSTRGTKKLVGKMDDTVAVSDDATQVFDETVAIEDQTVAIKEDQTVAIHDDATQVFGETVATEDQTVAIKEDQTVAIHDDATQVVEDKPIHTNSGERRKRKEKVEADDATQVFDETVAPNEDQTVAVTEDQTVAVHEDDTHEDEDTDKSVPNKASAGSKQQPRQNDDTVVTSEDATQVFDETVAVQEGSPEIVEAKPSQSKSGRRRKQADKVEDTVTVNEDATQVFEEAIKEEVTEVAAVKAEDTEISSHVETKSKRTRGNKKVKKETLTENAAAKESLTNKFDMLPVEMSEKTADETDSTTVRKSSRTRGKASLPEKDDRKAETLRNELRRTRGKGDKTEDESKGAKHERKGKKTSIANKKAQDMEAATQIFAENDPPDEAATQRYSETEDEPATQRYGGSGDEAATQRYGEAEDDDLTPDLDEIEDEKPDAVPVVAERSRGRSPLKSALASPKKKKSPSPKKVQFISQNSETGSESSEPSRRSKRGNRARQKEVVTEASNDTKSAAEPQNKRQKRQKAVISEDSAESKPGKTVSKAQEKIETAKNAVNSETDKNRTNKRQTRGKEIKTESSLENNEFETEQTVKSNRRGRKSVDTEVSDKLESKGRRTRVSLPAVLEGSESEISKNLGKRKGGKSSTDEIESTVKEKSKKNLRGKGAIHDKKETEDNKEEVTDHSLSQTGKPSEKKETTDDSSQKNRRTKQISEKEGSGDSEQIVKRTGRQTRATLETNKMKNPKETESDTTNNHSETFVEPNATRSNRNSRKKDLSETVKSGNDQKVKHDHVKSDGDKREPSPHTITRTRVSKNKSKDGLTNEVKKELTEETETDSKRSVKGKAGKGGKGKGSKVESETEDASQTNEKKSAVAEKEAVQTNVKNSTRGKTVKGGKGSKVETEASADIVKEEQTDEEVKNESKGSTRSKRGRTNKMALKEEKQEEAPVEDNFTGRSRRLKRKESASSSNDSQESEQGETPAKRQRQKAHSNTSTPKNAGKQASTVITPRGTSNKQLETSVTNSPTLRKTTTEGGKAKVMFTGVIDEQGEKIVKELGGELVTSVTECTHLVTDQVRRTVKFLCCLSRGIPIVSPQWLASSKTSAFFVDPVPFLVRDEASERKYKFHLDHAIDKASKENVFQGFTFHVTKSVKPEPQHMSEIVKCAGAKCVNKMPSSSAQGKTVVISCPEDQAQCEPAYKGAVPVMTAEFILTGILRQEVDWQSFKLSKEEHGNKRQTATSSHVTAAKKRKR